MKTTLKITLCLAGGALLGGCANVDPQGVTADPILNGANTVIGYRGEVLVYGSGGCSGTALRNDWVLTARHCVDASPSSPTVPITVVLGTQTAYSDAVVRRTDVDAALVHLSTPLTLNGSTTGYRMELYAGSTASLIGQTLECTGYGLNTMTTGYGAQRRALLPVAGLGRDPRYYQLVPNSAGQIQWSGDSGSSCFLGSVATGITSVCSYASWCEQTGAESFRDWAAQTMGDTAPNDSFSSATTLTLARYETVVAGSTARASHDGPTVPCGCTSGANVWYRFTLSERAVVYFDTAGSAFDTSLFLTNSAGAALAAQTATPTVGLCNDDSLCATGGFTSIRQSRSAGVLDAGTYYVAVRGCGAGAFQLHAQMMPTSMGAFFYASAPLAGDSTTGSTSLLGGGVSTGTCGGAASGEDVRWFMTCGAQTQLFSLCQGDGASFTRSLAGRTYDPAMYVTSALSGAELACNDDGGASGVNCAGTGGDGAQYGSRLPAIAGTRGLNAVTIDERLNASGMQYTLRYTIR